MGILPVRTSGALAAVLRHLDQRMPAATTGLPFVTAPDKFEALASGWVTADEFDARVRPQAKLGGDR